MRLLIVEDEIILRDSLATSLGREHDVEAVFTLTDALDVMEMVETNDVDIILMDVCTEHGSSGLIAAKKVKETHPDVRIVIMTGMPEVSFVKQARNAGVESFIYKNVGISYLLNVLRSTLDGYSTYPNSRQFPDVDVPEFEPDELEILRLACEGKQRNEIAKELHLSDGTVKRRITEILAKTGYDSILKLAVHMVTKGYIVPEMEWSPAQDDAGHRERKPQ